MPRIEEPAEPWRSFFADVDSRLSEDVQLHCCGGFVAVTVATPPENYEDRLVPMFPSAWRRLQLFALEAHDLALSKLERNGDRDRDDVQQLARAGHLRPEVLKERYFSELRPNLLAHETRHDLTLQLWLESYWPL